MLTVRSHSSSIVHVSRPPPSQSHVSVDGLSKVMLTESATLHREDGQELAVLTSQRSIRTGEQVRVYPLQQDMRVEGRGWSGYRSILNRPGLPIIMSVVSMTVPITMMIDIGHFHAPSDASGRVPCFAHEGLMRMGELK